MLDCQSHFCKRFCHAGSCQDTSESVTSSTLAAIAGMSKSQSCTQICGRIRPLCGHPCQALCHAGRDCPKLICPILITLHCPCGRRKAELQCGRGGEDDNMPQMAQRELLCDEFCEKEKRSKQLADAFGKVIDQEMYSDVLLSLARANPSFIQKMEKKFEELLRSSSGSNKILFPPMQRIQRQIVHELAKAYNLESESQDREPNRSVIVTKRKDSRM